MATGPKSDRNDAASPTRGFFDALAERGREPLLGRVSGTIRFDLGAGRDVERWHVKVKKGRVDVSHKKGPAEAVVRAERALFDDIAAGRANAMTAFLRGTFVAEGDLGLVMRFQRLFPGPPRKRSRSRSRSGSARERNR